ncbi:MAG: TlpA family protein disulfide reductase [Candidatus Eisenbacteria bacterium]|nr:TlpA family protein disulfide reductase [Candidatus Eisenbacteria bacterium]
MTHTVRKPSLRSTLTTLAVCATLSVAAAGAAGGAAPRDAAAFGVSSDRAAELVRTHVLAAADGRSFRIADLKGVTVVNFWASWCAPCRRELPRLAALDRELRSSGGRVVAISIDEDRRNAERFLRANAPSLGVAFDGPEALARSLDLRNVPCTIVLDRSGAIAYVTARSDERGLADLADAVRRVSAGQPVALEGGAR